MILSSPLNLMAEQNKWVDYELQDASLDVVGDMLKLSSIPIGAGANYRIGREVMYKTLYIRGKIQAAGSRGTPAPIWAPPCRTRLVVVLDRQPILDDFGPPYVDKGSMKLTNVFFNFNDWNVDSLPDWNYLDRFLILYDRTDILQPVVNDTDGITATDTVINLDIEIPLDGIISVQGPNGSGLVYDNGIITNLLGIGIFSDVTTTEVPPDDYLPDLSLNVRLRYEDK